MYGLFAAVILMIPGILLVFMPVFPALPYMFVISVLYAWANNFARLNGREIMVLAILMLFSVMVDHLSGVLGAKYGGANGKSMLAGFLGAIIGGLIGGPAAAFVLLFVGIFVAEVAQLKTFAAALEAARAGLLGALAGYIVNVVVAFVFFGVFLYFTLR
jgi:uncharacterized protein YqgC (DUF456 family)